MAVGTIYLLTSLLISTVVVHSNYITNKNIRHHIGDEALTNVLAMEEFMSKFNKTYGNIEEALERYTIFMNNYNAEEKHNKLYDFGLSDYKMGFYEFEDLTYEEIIAKYTGIDPDEIPDSDTEYLRTFDYYTPINIGEEPDFLDYRIKGAINPVSVQGECGACWAFGMVTTIESQIFLKYGELINLSEQDLVDCTKLRYTKGCGGGFFPTALIYIVDKGIAYRDDYPYTANNESKCNEVVPKTFYKVTGSKRVKPNNDTELLNALVNLGPIWIAFYVSPNFYKYEKGIYVDELCTNLSPSMINHAMVLVGYGTENGKDYWIIRNSWGDWWGENGYIRVGRQVENHCLISAHGYIPIVEDTKARRLMPAQS